MKQPSEPTIAYIALGTNLGDRLANLRAALNALEQHLTVEHVSSLYETEPAYVTDQPRFLNAVVSGTTLLAPEALLLALKRIEHDLGRMASTRYGPRLIDLDILLYGDLHTHGEQLSIPHPRLAERPFVLVPLAEIAPDLVPPGLSETARMLAARVHGQGDIIACVGKLK